MKPTTAQRFGSLGKSFGAPAAAAAVIGAALLASDTSDTSETAWSPAAACLLPDVLPVAGTLLSYGGSRQLAAGGTVTHSGALNLDANALTCGRISTRQSGTGINIETDGLIRGDAWPYNDYGFVKIQNAVNIGRGLFTRLNAGGYNNGIIVQGINSTSIGIQFASASQAQGSPLSHLLYTVGSGFALLGSDATTPMSLSCGAITASGNIQVGTSGPILVGNVGGTGRFQVTRNDGTSDFYVGAGGSGGTSMRWFGLSSNAPGVAATDVEMRRNATGPAWIAQAEGGLQVRNLANSADAALTCGAITASGALTASSLKAGVGGIQTEQLGNGFNFVSAGFFIATANGVFKFSDVTDATFGRLQLGGTTSAYPAIKRSGTTTAFRLADDSADGPIACAAITASGAIQETTTQSALDPTTTNIPSGKRQGWYNSTLSEFRDWVNIGGTLLKSAAYT